MKNILVTGATGFIGQRLVNHLKSEGFSIRAIGRTSVPGVDTSICDFLDSNIPENVFKDIDVVFHLAGYTHDLESRSGVNDVYQKINVGVTVDLLSLSVKYKIKKFIFVSSVKAGGIPVKGECACEKDQNNPEGVYGKTKREAELKVLEVGRNSNMHVSILRPTLIYGPNVKGNLQLMMSAIEKGWFPPLPEVRNRRSMVHVDDVVRSILLLADSQQANGEIFITTDGREYSSRNIYETMCRVLDKNIPNWSIPNFLFSTITLINSSLKYKVDKLLADECYSSEKLKSIGFKSQKELKQMNETDF